MDEVDRPGDAGNEAARPRRIRPERRWPMAVAVIASIVLQVGAPRKGRVAGWWVFPIIAVVMLVVLIVMDPGRIDDRSGRTRRVTLGLIAMVTLGTVIGLVALLVDILRGEDLNAATLLGRGAAFWVTNIIVFSLWYWELDRGGPAERGAGTSVRPSFGFPEEAMPELVEPGWIPRYPDYLYLAFTNATAFSPTDTLPLATWAKLTMMLQSVISLVTAVLVVARAINVLPG